MNDCPLAAAIRHNQMTPSGRTGDELMCLIFERGRDLRPSWTEPESGPVRSATRATGVPAGHLVPTAETALWLIEREAS